MLICPKNYGPVLYSSIFFLRIKLIQAMNLIKSKSSTKIWPYRPSSQQRKKYYLETDSFFENVKRKKTASDWK